MARLPTRGSGVATPLRGKAELRKVLIELCPDGNFSEADTNEIYGRLERIIGQWSADTNRLDVAPLPKTFSAMGGKLNEIADILYGHETRCHWRGQIQS